MSATISVAMASESHGWVIAVTDSPDRLVMAETLVVGNIRGDHDDDSVPPGKAELKAWLWPFPGGAIRLGTHTEAVTAASPDVLRDRLQKRADRQGHWWERAEAVA